MGCLFLCYAILYLVSIVAMDLPFAIRWLRRNDKNKSDSNMNGQVPALTLVAGVFIFAVLPLGLMHYGMLHANETTLESMRKPNLVRNTLDGWSLRTRQENFKTVFGTKVLSWFF